MLATGYKRYHSKLTVDADERCDGVQDRAENVDEGSEDVGDVVQVTEAGESTASLAAEDVAEAAEQTAVVATSAGAGAGASSYGWNSGDARKCDSRNSDNGNNRDSGRAQGAKERAQGSKGAVEAGEVADEGGQGLRQLRRSGDGAHGVGCDGRLAFNPSRIMSKLLTEGIDESLNLPTDGVEAVDTTRGGCLAGRKGGGESAGKKGDSNRNGLHFESGVYLRGKLSRLLKR